MKEREWGRKNRWGVGGGRAKRGEEGGRGGGELRGKTAAFGSCRERRGRDQWEQRELKKGGRGGRRGGRKWRWRWRREHGRWHGGGGGGFRGLRWGWRLQLWGKKQ